MQDFAVCFLVNRGCYLAGIFLRECWERRLGSGFVSGCGFLVFDECGGDSGSGDHAGGGALVDDADGHAVEDAGDVVLDALTGGEVGHGGAVGGGCVVRDGELGGVAAFGALEKFAIEEWVVAGGLLEPFKVCEDTVAGVAAALDGFAERRVKAGSVAWTCHKPGLSFSGEMGCAISMMTETGK
jgi:hypothetical protein